HFGSPRDEDKVDAAGQLRPAEPKRLPEEPAQAIANVSLAPLPADRKADARVRQLVLTYAQLQRVIANRAAPLVDMLEVRVSRDPHGLRQGVVFSHVSNRNGWGGYFQGTEARGS